MQKIVSTARQLGYMIASAFAIAAALFVFGLSLSLNPGIAGSVVIAGWVTTGAALALLLVCAVGVYLFFKVHRSVYERSGMEESLRQKEEAYSALFTNPIDMVYIFDLGGNFIEANPRALQTLGYTAEEFRTLNFASLLDEEQLASALVKLDDIMKNGVKDEPFEIRLKCRDGRYLDIETNGAIITHDGQPYALLCIARDVTERKRIEKELREADEKYRTHFEKVSDVIFTYDNEFRILDISSSVEKILGYKPEELIGRTFPELNILAEDTLPFAAEDALHVLGGGSIGSREYKFIAKDGSIIYGDISGAPLVSDGKVVGVVSVARDITERKKHAQELLLEKRFSEALIDSIPGTFYVIDKSMKYIRWNRNHEKVLGYSPEEMRQVDTVKAVVKEDRKRIAGLIREVASGHTVDVETTVLTKEGKRIPYALCVAPLTIEDEMYIIGVGIDMSRRKEAELALEKAMEDLKRSNEELQQFAYVASHDLQEPLRMVSSYVQLLEKRYKDKLDEDAHDFIDYAVSGTKRMQNLINDLLTYSRVGTRKKPFEPVESSAILNDALSNLEVAINESGATISHGKLPRIVGDAGQLLQVFQNLLGNAVKFRGKEPPLVQVDAERKNGNWVFAVKDNGLGIEPQFYERIFVIFQRLHGSEYEGTGMGLAITRKIVQRHGGHVWVESEPGRGSTFYFTIPAREKGDT